MTSFPKGSVWRRWDLHVHTPMSIVQQYGGNTKQAWDSFIGTLAALPPDVAVVGITDYLFLDGYEYLLTRRDEIPNIVAIFPNIEFRLNTFSGTANNNRRHNFHVIFDPTVPVATIKEQLLNCLSRAYKIEDSVEWHQTPTPSSLEELGKSIQAAAPEGNPVHSKPAMQVGFENITYSREDILDNLEKSCFKGRYLLAIGYSEWDQARWDQSAADKRSLINAAHFSLCCNDDVSQLVEHIEDLQANKLNSLLLHSSDAHCLERVGLTKLWIKADPTFSGLKQVVNEHDRVFLGDAPPCLKQPHEVITKVVIPSSSGWFQTGFEQELNDDLVAIIGGRGSGKSALAEMIACGAGSCDPSPDSFSSKASRHESSITHTKVELVWGDGSTSRGIVGIGGSDLGRVKYLPQEAVDDLCDPDNSDILLQQIENLIFQALNETDKAGASNFRELQSTVLAGYEFEQQRIVAEIKEYNQEFNSLANAIASLPSKDKEFAAKRLELQALEKDLPKLPEADLKGQEALARLMEAKKQFEALIVTRKRLQEKIVGIATKLRLFVADATKFQSELLEAVKSVGVSNLEAFSFTIDVARMQRVLEARRQELQTEIEVLDSGSLERVQVLAGSDLTLSGFTNYVSLVKCIEEQTAKTRAFESMKLKYQQQKLLISERAKGIAALEREINRTRTELVPAKKAVSQARQDKYCEYFTILASERAEIEKLYTPLQTSLNQGSDTDKRLKFEAKYAYRLKKHLERGFSIIDRTKKGNFRDPNQLRQALEQLWGGFVQSDFDSAKIKEGLKAFLERWLSLDGVRTPEKLTIASQLRDDFTAEDFFNWLLDPSHFEVVSSITFDGTDLYVLSPGQKGIVLLMLYLGMERTDTRPLIIDQPEDNLDNLTVYTDLIHLFRERKKYRQIIIITHNPNLVVNTDAEQVIVASYDGKALPRIQYTSGSLENEAARTPGVDVAKLKDGIIERVCDVLEGGPTAFSKRSKKYALSPKLA